MDVSAGVLKGNFMYLLKVSNDIKKVSFYHIQLEVTAF